MPGPDDQPYADRIRALERARIADGVAHRPSAPPEDTDGHAVDPDRPRAGALPPGLAAHVLGAEDAEEAGDAGPDPDPAD